MNAGIYNDSLSKTHITLPTEPAELRHVYKSYVIRLKRRDELKRLLWKGGIQTKIEYAPIHLNKIFSYLNYKPDNFPVTEECSREVLSLPVSQFLLEDEIKTIARRIETSNILKERG